MSMNGIGSTHSIDLESASRRPTFLSSMKVERLDSSHVEDDGCVKILLPFLKSLSDLATPKECIEVLRDKERFQFFEPELQSAITAKPGKALFKKVKFVEFQDVMLRWRVIGAAF